MGGPQEQGTNQDLEDLWRFTNYVLPKYANHVVDFPENNVNWLGATLFPYVETY